MHPSNLSAPEQYSNEQCCENNQPAPILAESKAPLPWSSGLFDCRDDVPNCCMTFCCPCITFGRIAEIVDKGSTPCCVKAALYGLIAQLTGCPCLYSYTYRSKMRQQYTLEESPNGDCWVHFLNEPCALCQEYRELQNRGFDMTIGWQRNVEQRTRGAMAATAPVIGGGMSR